MHNLPNRWDVQALKVYTQGAIARVESAQSEQDWRRAAIYAERVFSDARKRFKVCPLPAWWW
jgi:hypothetical protein